jgi:vacuolar-type H+-ATPase subunit I/STV1
LIIAFLLFGLYITAEIDLGLYFLDGYRQEKYLSFISESYMILQIVVGIFSILVAASLSSKTNDYLICYTTENRCQKLEFILARYLTGIIVIGMTVVLGIMSKLLLMILLTPFKYNIDFLISMYGWVFIEGLFFFFLTSLLYSLLNSFLVMILPIALFWYKKTLYMGQSLSEEARFLLQVIPGFYLEGEKITAYMKLENYLLPIGLIFSLCFVINSYKDCR